MMVTDLVPAASLVSSRQMVDELGRRLPELEGQTAPLALGLHRLTTLISDLKIIQRDAAKMLAGSMDRNRAGNPMQDQFVAELNLRIVRVTQGGDWRDIDYRTAVHAVLAAQVREDEGELVLDHLAQALIDCFSFAGLKSNESKGTGLAHYGLGRERYGHQEPTSYTAKVEGGD